jgi:hypothetical protein
LTRNQNSVNALAKLRELNADIDAVMLAMKIGGGWEVERRKYDPAVSAQDRTVTIYKPETPKRNTAALIARRSGLKERYISLLATDKASKPLDRARALLQIAKGVAVRGDKRGQTFKAHANAIGNRASTADLVRSYQVAGFKPQPDDGQEKGVPMLRRPKA